MYTNQDNLQTESLPWAEILSVLQNPELAGKFDAIPQSSLKYILDDKNIGKVTASALKFLQEFDPSKATQDEATALAGKMREFAKKIVESQQV